MKKRVLSVKGWFILCLFICFTVASCKQQRKFYIDSFNGNDGLSGKSPEKAWQTLERVNKEIFHPGDSILFLCNGYWKGQLKPMGSGRPGLPIVIGSYGTGHLPVIDGAGITGVGVVNLHNQSFWEITWLEIINPAASEGDRRGVAITASDYGTANHFHLKNLIIHDISGIPGNGDEAKRTAGIYLATISDSVVPTRFHDILIEYCEIYNVDNQGIVTNNEIAVNDYPGSREWHQRKVTGLVIRNNLIHHISKNAMIIRLAEYGTIEHNLCYETALKTTGNTMFSRSASGTVFQYNEAFLNRSPDYDGSMYDPDLNSPGTIWRHSFSHHNSHGLVWFCTTKNDRDIEVYNNISLNDKGSLVYFNYEFSGAEVRHNIFYIKEGLSPVLIRERPGVPHRYRFDHNTVINQSRETSLSLDPDPENIQQRAFSSNILKGFPLVNNLPGLFQDHSPEKPPIPGVYEIHDLIFDQLPETIPLTRPIGLVNGRPVTRHELDREIRRCRAMTLHNYFSLKIPEKNSRTAFTRPDSIEAVIEKEAWKNISCIKLIESLFEKNNIPFPSGLMHSVELLPYINHRRQWQAGQGKTVYGPLRFNEKQLFDYLFALASIELQDHLFSTNEKITDQMVSDYFDRHRKRIGWTRYKSYKDYQTRIIEEMKKDFFNDFLAEEMKKISIQYIPPEN